MAQKPQDIEKSLEILLAADDASVAPALEAKDLVRRVLEFANTGKPKGLPGAKILEHGGQTFYLDTGDLQAELRRDLSAVIAGELSGPAVGRLLKQARHVTVKTYQMDRGRLACKERHYVRDLPTLLAGQLLLIRSDELLRDDVKQCRWPECGRFFLASDDLDDPSAPGRRRHRYCSPEHMDLAQSTPAERTRKWRENRAKKLAAAARHK